MKFKLVAYNPVQDCGSYTVLEGEEALEYWLEKRGEFGTERDAPYNIESNELIDGIRVQS